MGVDPPQTLSPEMVPPSMRTAGAVTPAAAGEDRVTKYLLHALRSKYNEMKSSEHNQPILFLLRCLRVFTCGPEFPQEMLLQCFCTLFCDKNGNLVHNHRFLLQTKRKTARAVL